MQILNDDTVRQGYKTVIEYIYQIKSNLIFKLKEVVIMEGLL